MTYSTFRPVRSWLTGMIVTFALVLVAGLAHAQGYSIRTGDTLTIEVLEDPGLNRKVLVLPDGSFSFPFVGSVQARGRTVGAVQATLVQGLTPNFAAPPNVYVSVASVTVPRSSGAAAVRNYSIYAMGEVQKPGRIEVPSSDGITLLQALAQSGGFTKFAATKRIQLRRPDTATGEERVYIFNYQGGKGISGATRLMPGDVIVVPQRRLFE